MYLHVLRVTQPGTQGYLTVPSILLRTPQLGESGDLHLHQRLMAPSFCL